MSAYISVSIKLNPYNKDAADLLAAFLADEGFETFEESEDGLKAYIPESNYNEEGVRRALDNNPFETETIWTKEIIAYRDWNEEWEKKYFKPLVLAGGKCVVHSTFHTDYPHAEYEIIVDPKMAFGTGHHATTTMMVNHLFNSDLKGKRVLDMGTGTGILAIISKKLGASEAIGIEIDKGAYENALENACLNNVELKLIHGDAGKLEDIESFDLFLANINRNIILADMEKYTNSIKPGGLLIISGFYEKDIPLLSHSLETNGFKIQDITKEAGEWASIRAVKRI